MMCATPTIAYRRIGINPDTGNHYSPVCFRQFRQIFEGSPLPLDQRVRIMSDYYRACPSGLEAVIMPCKRCALCCRAYKRMWSYRLVCESKSAGESMFLTLTVDDDHMQEVFPGGSLRHKPFQDFMKRLRITLARGYWYDYVPPFTPVRSIVHLPRNLERRFYKRDKIRFYMCGEYGDSSMRPHYHCCVFGARFPDSYFAKKVGNQAYYKSPTLSRLWSYGEMSLFSDVTPSSAAYVAGYVDKKLDRDQDWFKAYGLAPEYVRMSNGIGRDHFDEEKDSLYRMTSAGDYFGEFFLLGDRFVPAPVYFDRLLQLQSPEKFDKIRAARECRRLESLRLMPVEEHFNESGRKCAVLLARKKEREIREMT